MREEDKVRPPLPGAFFITWPARPLRPSISTSCWATTGWDCLEVRRRGGYLLPPGHSGQPHSLVCLTPAPGTLGLNRVILLRCEGTSWVPFFCWVLSPMGPHPSMGGPGKTWCVQDEACSHLAHHPTQRWGLRPEPERARAEGLWPPHWGGYTLPLPTFSSGLPAQSREGL